MPSPSSIPSSSSESSFKFLPYGALIQEFIVHGHNLVLSLPTEADYRANHGPFFGATIGRTTNRTRNAVIPNLNGRSYHLAANDPPNSLHGGTKGWHAQDFKGPQPINRNGTEGVEFTYTSSDGDEGYPGTVECHVYYTASKEPSSASSPEKTILDIEYEVHFLTNNNNSNTTNSKEDTAEETVIGVTNHSYFTVAPPAAPNTEKTTLTLGTHAHLELDSTGIPTGHIIPSHASCPAAEPGTPFTLGATAPSFDDCFVFPPRATNNTADDRPVTDAGKDIPLDTRPLSLRMAARMQHPDTKLALEVWTTEPGFQLYTGEGINVPVLGDGGGFGARSGVAIEPSRFVDAAGREEWIGQVKVKRGGVWGARSRYVCWKEE